MVAADGIAASIILIPKVTLMAQQVLSPLKLVLNRKKQKSYDR